MNLKEDRDEAVRVLKIEAQALLDLAERVDDSFSKAIDILLGCSGKVVVSGIGKSGQVGQKISSTLSSTGTPSFFLSPAESVHGDLGVISDTDVVVGVSYGGESQEMAEIIKYVVRKGIPLIALTGKPSSSLGAAASVCLNVLVEREACPLGVAPTASSTATLAMGDALAMALLKRRGFNESQFAEFHPGGHLGRRLLTRVVDLMRRGDELPCVVRSTPIKEVVSLMTGQKVRGVCAVVDEQGGLIGAITDGDIRRYLQKTSGALEARAQDVMSQDPKVVDGEEMAERALLMMEQLRIRLLFVVDLQSPFPRKPIGVLELQELLEAKIR